MQSLLIGYPMKADGINNEFQLVDYQLTELKFELLKLKKRSEDEINGLKRQLAELQNKQ